mgnify:CR=1 FL=1
MKLLMAVAVTMFLMGCQTQAVKEQPYIPDESKIEHVQALPNFEESMVTLDMAEFARRH